MTNMCNYMVATHISWLVRCLSCAPGFSQSNQQYNQEPPTLPLHYSPTFPTLSANYTSRLSHLATSLPSSLSDLTTSLSSNLSYLATSLSSYLFHLPNSLLSHLFGSPPSQRQTEYQYSYIKKTGQIPVTNSQAVTHESWLVRCSPCAPGFT